MFIVSEECKTLDGEEGKCYSQKECSSLGGSWKDTCASGYGVCCICKWNKAGTFLKLKSNINS